jgi:hypothetical protein
VNRTTVWGNVSSFELESLPYTIRTTLVVTLVDGACANFNTSAVVAAPAPAGLALAAGAVPFLGLLRRRLRATPTTAA